MDKLRCPCCGNYTIESNDEVIVEICEICFWQYDLPAHNKPDISIGANRISLNDARENYIKYGACKKEFVDKGLVREPFSTELPQNQ